jgi:hypothetical protein
MEIISGSPNALGPAAEFLFQPKPRKKLGRHNSESMKSSPRKDIRAVNTTPHIKIGNPTQNKRRVGQNHTFIGIYGVHMVFLAGKSPYIRSYMVQIFGSGQP